jgi:small conductance mechanosensitive channel
VVDISGVQGTVRSVSVVSTLVTTPGNEVIVVPNSKVWGNVIRNGSMSNTRRMELTVAVARKESVEKVQRLLEDIVKDHPLILVAPEPTIRVSDLTDAALKFLVQPWTRARHGRRAGGPVAVRQGEDGARGDRGGVIGLIVQLFSHEDPRAG